MKIRDHQQILIILTKNTNNNYKLRRKWNLIAISIIKKIVVSFLHLI